MIEDNTKGKRMFWKWKQGKPTFKIQMKRTVLNTSCEKYSFENMNQGSSLVKISASSKSIETKLPKTPNN